MSPKEIFTPTTILILGVALLLPAAGLMLILFGKRKKKQGQSKFDAFFYRLYFEFKKVPFIKTYIRNKTRQMQAMSVFSKREVCIKVARYFSMTAIVTTITVIIALIMFDDLVSVVLCSFLAYLLPTTFIEKRIARTNHVVYYQMKYAVENLRLEYLRCYNVVEALENVQCGNRLVKIFDELRQVLVSANGELRLKEFYEITPFRPIQTLAQICYHINNTGDEMDQYGNSAFVEGLLVMLSDINEELERLNYQKMKFGKIEYLCLLPIPCIKIVESFFSANMPGTVILYKGPYGYIVHVAIIIVAIATFSMVSRINNPSAIEADDRIAFIKKLISIKSVRYFMHTIGPKNAKRRRLITLLHEAFSKKTVEEFYFEKLGYSVLAFIVLMLTFYSGVTIGKQFMLNNTQSLSMGANDDLSKYEKEDILALDNEYMDNIRAGYVYEEDELISFIRLSLPGLTDLQINEQISRLEKKYKFIESMYFRWYFIPIAFCLSILGWFVPGRALKMRIKLLKQEEEEEFLQIQTVMIILMSMNCDTMEALEYLSQLTRVHKEMFVDCYHSYASDPMAALAKMEERTPIPDFKRFINKLRLTVDELSLKEAFGDLKMDREHICRERDMTLRDNIDSKRRKCGSMVQIGFYMVIILLFVGPLMYLGMSEMMGGISSLQGL